LLLADRVGLRQNAARAAELDDFGAVLAQFPDRRANLFRAVRDLRRRHAYRRREFGRVAMAAGRADRIGRRHDARTRYEPRFDALLERDIVVVIGTHVAHGRESRFERLLRVCDADHGPKIIRELQGVIPE
jgi:hypothetical protein